jgi:hypothetical protein
VARRGGQFGGEGPAVHGQISELVAKTPPTVTVLASVDTNLKVLNEALCTLLPTALADIIRKMKPGGPPAYLTPRTSKGDLFMRDGEGSEDHCAHQ